MDRVIVQVGALPQDTDILNTNLFALINDGFKNQALLGAATVVAGLAVTPTTPTASLQVNVATGVIFQMDEIDASAYGSLGTNTSNIMKQGILSTAQVLSITPPSTSGFSQVFLVEAILNDVDGGQEVESYYNSANPSQPFSGPANSGSSNFTIRQCKCVVALKAGTPASTGTQVAPTVDAGFVPLFTITVANGQTQITSGNIVQVPSAPFFPTIPQIPYQVQQGTYTYAGTDTGTANNYVIAFAAGQPIPAAYNVGMEVEFKALNASTGASQINVNGLGNVTIRRANGVATAANDIVSGQIVKLKYDGTFFQITNYIGAGTTSNTTTVTDIPYVADSGSAGAIIATYSPAITSLTDGLYLAVKLANPLINGGTINVNGLGAKAIVLGDATPPPFNTFVAGMTVLLVYSTALGKFQVANTSAGMFYLKPTSSYSIFVNTSTGSDTLFDGTSASVTGIGGQGPFKTIGKAMLAAFGYAPSQFMITIQVAAGTYNEVVTTPATAGPNVTINGASASSVIVSSGATASITVQGPNSLTVENLTIQNSGNSNTHGFVATNGATMFTSNCGSNGITGSVFSAVAGGTIFPGNHTFNGSCYSCFEAANNGTIYFEAGTFTYSTSISVSFATVMAQTGVVTYNANFSAPTFVNPGFVSGQKYDALLNGVINFGGLGISFLPGTVAGTSSTGGQYQP